MKICPQCNSQLDDNSSFCTVCGFNFAQGQQNQQQNQAYYEPNQNQQSRMNNFAEPYDHTAEFDPKDVSDNKVIAMLVYLLGAIGIFIALLASDNSPFVAFHVRQALKITVVSVLLGIITAVLCWTIIVPIAAAVCYVIILVIKIICFFDICKGRAKEPAIIRNFGFLK